MPITDEQIMLTLAGLTYRGFHDVTRGEGHDRRVRDAVEAGLRTLPPVADRWELVWGPVTSRSPGEHVDTNAMFVVRHVTERHRHVVAIRGTNPISPSDWLFGDFWIHATVPWPWAPPGSGAATSASTALGLRDLQTMRARPASAAAGGKGAALLGRTVGAVARAGVEAVSRLDASLAGVRATLRAHVARPLQKWLNAVGGPGALDAVLGDAARVPERLPEILRPRPGAGDVDEPDLLTFLAGQAARPGDALDVSVTGHSKGAALAQALALWLQDALDSPAERWDAGRGARIRCYGFACPTPGNAAFARRFEERLGPTHHQVRNLHDVVTHAWQADELERIAGLYGSRTAALKPVVEAIAAKVAPHGYRHVHVGVRPIQGRLVASRSVALEFAHQHLDAYLIALGLDAHDIDALTLFVG